MKIYRLTIALVLTISITVSCSRKSEQAEVTAERAIQIATNFAESKKFNTKETAVELMKFKKDLEKGPIRIDWLLHTFPRDKVPELIKNDFWIVYIYPKKTSIIGGDFNVLVDLRTGNVIASKAGM